MKSHRRSSWGLIAASLLALAATGCSCSEETPTTDGGALDGASPTLDAGDIGDGSVGEGCGDGVRDRDNEICDDGNNTDGDGCSADCSSDESCGNGVVDAVAGELCDDGNNDNGDSCRMDCLSDYRCGNNVVDTAASGASEDEACDDGNTLNGDGCSAACDSDETCGNSVVDLGAGEVCDDGNTDDGDECSGDCMSSTLCGNGALDGAEECDDSNNDDGDGCNASCQIERCGNGRVDAGETCDDGDADETNGCTTGCGYTCGDDTDCADADLCNGTETCTDGGTTASRCAAGTPLSDGDGCGSGLICDGGACVTAACGDGFTTAPEACDDMNSTNGDGCDNDCTFTCTRRRDCRDTNLCNGREDCLDPGTTMSRCVPGTPLSDGDSCGTGRICNGGVCSTAGCGDGIVVSPEECDDMNTTAGDGCESDCSFTCSVAADCSDGDTCNGAEVCTGGGTLASRCGAGSPPADGTACGGGNICNGGGCVAPRCGDGLVTGSEDCDDMNSVAGDGCENDCAFTCSSNADCLNANVCDGDETCSNPGTDTSQCVAGTPAATGTLCDRGASPPTRDICDMTTETCNASVCGDGYPDSGTIPPETCDDGNTMSGDGCSAACQTEMSLPPTGFRIDTLRLISPRITAQIPFGNPGCQDITDNCVNVFLAGCVEDSVNVLLQTALNPMPGGDYSLHLVNLFRPLNPAAPMTPAELHLNAACTAGAPDDCGPDAMPDIVLADAVNTSVGTCFTPVAADVNGNPGPTYAPTANTVGGPCFNATIPTLTINISGIDIPLVDATVAATYSGSPTDRLVSGVVTGFLSEDDATTTLLPATLPAPLGGSPLYEHLQGGNIQVNGVDDGCNRGGGTHEDDSDMNGSTRGFWFFLNFTGELINWTGP